jgi:mannose-6-phosphate isomerase-like protein (cupin superfamily)
MEEIPWGLVERPAFVRADARGTFEELVNAGRWESLIHGVMKRGAVLGHHYHAHTVVCYWLLAGSARITTVDVTTRARHERSIGAGQGFVFRPSEARIIEHLEDSRFVMLKSHRFDPAAPDLIEYQVS